MLVQVDLLNVTELHPRFDRKIANVRLESVGDSLTVRLADHVEHPHSVTLWKLRLSPASIDGIASDPVAPDSWEHGHRVAVYTGLADGLYTVPFVRNWNSRFDDVVVRVAGTTVEILDKNTDPDRDEKVAAFLGESV